MDRHPHGRHPRSLCSGEKSNRRQRRRVASALDVGVGVVKKKNEIEKVGAAKCVEYVVGLSL